MKMLSSKIVFCCFFQLIENAVNQENSPLILTPLIEAGNIKEAQSAAEVNHHSMKGIKSFSGYFTVDKRFDSNLFFWFFPSNSDPENDPVVLYLTGGPGASSVGHIFTGIGPFEMQSDDDLIFEKYAWTRNHSVIFVDNPIEVGFSYTKGDYARNQTTIGEHLYEALLQFFQMFPELQENDFFVAGISYGGKYVPAVSYTIHKNNPSAKQKINLKGLAIEDGLSDPINQLQYSGFLYQIGLIDGNGKKEMEELEDQIVGHIQRQEWRSAFESIENLILPKDENTTSLFRNLTGFENNHNFLMQRSSKIQPNFEKYLGRIDVVDAIHAKNKTYEFMNKLVFEALSEDIPKSVAPWISELLSHYRVLVFTGQLDVLVAYPLVENYLGKLKFSSANEYKTAKRHIWRLGGDVAGYIKQAGNLTEVMVRNASHTACEDQPFWCQDLVTNFFRNKQLY